MVKVSVIIGVYNCADTLCEALDSLYAQTFKDFEIILCDDGSSDGTYGVARKYRDDHDNVVLLRNDKNLGLNKTLNRCLAVAQGEYIARMDGDDISLPERFEKEVRFLDEHPEYAIVSCPMKCFDEKGVFRFVKSVEEELTVESFNYGSPFAHPTVMMRKDALLQVGGYTESKWLLRIEDYNLWMKMYAAGYRGYRLAEHLYMFRDDRNAAKRRTFRARINGIYAHWLAYRILGLSTKKFIRYVYRSLAKGVMPLWCYMYLRNRRYRN